MKKALLAVFILCSISSLAITHIVTTVSDTGAGSLRSAVSNAMDNDTVRFSPALLAGGSNTIFLNSRILIDKGITLKGLYTQTDTLYISGKDSAGIFVVGLYNATKKTAHLDSLVLIDGKDVYGNNGGGIYVGSCDSVLISNSIIRSCLGREGAAIFNGISSPGLHGRVYVQNCELSGNSATDYGGAISSRDHHVYLDNCRVFDNYSGEDGGAIFTNSHRRLEIANSVFRNNHALENGGAVFCYYFDTLIVDQSVFHQSSGEYGGAIYAPEYNLIRNSDFFDNHTTYQYGYGGAIMITSFADSTFIENCNIHHNEAYRGAGIYSSSRIGIKGSNIYENKAASGGGGYFRSRVWVKESSIFDNEARFSGGGFYCHTSSRLNIDQSTVSGNFGQSGAGLYMYRLNAVDQLVVNNTTITENVGIFSAGIGYGYHTKSIHVNIGSSIVAGNQGGNDFLVNPLRDTITSRGYNLFGDTTISGVQPTDQLNVSKTDVNLRPLAYRGNATKCHPPGYQSFAINSGNPADLSDAQNRTIVGTRDVGSAEYDGVYHDTVSNCGPFLWNRSTYTQSGYYVDTVNTGGTIDTVATLSLVVNSPPTGTDSIVACQSYTWIDGVTYTTNNDSATYLIPRIGNCDSLVTLSLIITQPYNTTDSISACNSYTWIDGITYTASNNTAVDTLSSMSGCDSIVHLNLTILPSSGSTETVTACNSYTWINGVTYTASTDTVTHIVPNTAGCDSVITLDLTIHPTQSYIDVVSACNSFTWMDGITYTSNNNTATDTLTSAWGCDSIVTLDLIINSADTSVTLNDPSITANASGAAYRWLDCDNSFAVIPGETAQTFTATSNGSYAVEITQNGCVDTSFCKTIRTIGITEDPSSSMILLYPNPGKGEVTVELPHPTQAEILVYTIGGRLVYSKTYGHQSIIQFELNQPAGVYHVLIRTKENAENFKLVIER